KAKSGDFVYMDPPFSVKARRVFNEYDASIFSQRQLELLRQWMLRLDRKGISFVVSYAESEEGDFLREGFFSEVVRVRRNIAGFAANRRHTNEFLVSNVRPKDIGEIL
ncbi:MAG TPA: DNA adenine methylase, partial [Nitrososphaera sp.]|nr:DNA adenine methylase [Nitrososphaera sp.]